MTDEDIREEFHRKHVADKVFAAVRKKAGGDEALVELRKSDEVIIQSSTFFIIEGNVKWMIGNW